MKSMVGKENFRTFWPLLGLMFWTALIYRPALNGLFVFDDQPNILQNAAIKNANRLPGLLVHRQSHEKVKNLPTRPLFTLSLALNYYFSGLNPRGYHLFNLALHLANTLLVFGFIRLILSAQFNSLAASAALLAAAFFGVHPAMSEPVCYVSARADSMAAFFYLSAACLYCRDNSNLLSRTVSLLFFFLGLCCKEIVVTLPAILVLWEFGFNKKLTRSFPYWLTLLFMLLFRHYYFGGADYAITETSDRWTRASYLLTQTYVLWRYALLLAVPMGQTIDHLIKPIVSLQSPGFLFSFIGWFFALTGGLIVIKKQPQWKIPVIFFAGWFFIVLGPTSSIFPIRDAMTERRLYLPAVGTFGLLGLLIIKLKERLTEKNRSGLKFVLGAAAVGTFLIFSWKTYLRAKLYQDPMSLWQEAVTLNSGNARAFNSLGELYYQRNNKLKAKEMFAQSIKLEPNYAKGYNNMGVLLKELNLPQTAFSYFKKALELNPQSADAYNNIGLIYHGNGQMEQAQNAYEEAIRKNPNLPLAYNNLAVLYAQQNQIEKAVSYLRKALELDPEDKNAELNLSKLLMKLKS